MLSLDKMFEQSRLPRQAARALLGISLVAIASAALAQGQPASNTSNPVKSNSTGSASWQPTYKSPDDAAQALFLAVQGGNEGTVRAILGGGEELVTSDDPGADKLDRERFVQKYEQMHRVAAQTNGTEVLYIGAENWPFPIPLVSRNGAWRFDADAGAKEVLDRRIGENEETAIEVCQAFIEARRGPHAASEPSTQDEDGTFVDTLLSESSGVAASGPFHGYYFRVLDASPDGFVAIAYPAAYRTSGVMTFAVTQGGIVYERDLGAAGTQRAKTMHKGRPDSNWIPAEVEPNP
jgi:Protein of unknown function (DUF2950)